MADNFKPASDQVESNLNVKYALGNIYRSAFPSLANQVIYKVEGIKDLAKDKASNLVGLGYKLPESQSQSPELNYSGMPVVTLDENNVMSYLNTPIEQQIIFKAGNYDVLKNGIVVSRNFPNDYPLSASCICEFSRGKIMDKTNINGTEGYVKELWGFEDWTVNIKGLLFCERNNMSKNNSAIFPDEEIKKLKEYEEITDAVDVFGVMFGLLDIKSLSVEKVSVSDIKGVPNAKSFQMFCTSDTAQELIIKNNQLGN
jgi:hypothetical protein